MKLILGANAIRYPLTGIGRYAFELASGVKGTGRVESLRFLVRSRLTTELPTAPANGARNRLLATLRSQILKSAAMVLISRPFISGLQRRALRECDDAIFHGPNYYLPPHAGLCVSTFHDLSIYKFPECHPVERVRYMRRELPMALERAHLLICDSSFTRLELIGDLGVPSEKVRVVPLAAAEGFFPRTELECSEFLKRVGLRYRGYCLFVGTIDPRKNVMTLLDAYRALKFKTRMAMPLVIAGYKGWRSEAIHAHIQQAEQEGWLRYLRYVDEGDLPLLYASARVFAFPSLYEGFGLPILEAMASRVPVLSADSASLPEVCGGAAAMFSAHDVEALAANVLRATEDDAWLERLSRDGLRQAAKFSWERTVSETVTAYESLL